MKEYITQTTFNKIMTFLEQQKVYVISKKKCKKFLNGVYWIARSGAPWRFLPECYGKWNSIYKRFNEWSKKGIWEKLLTFCIQNPDLEHVMIDSTIVRAHACAAGYGNPEEQGLGRSVGGFTCKIHTTIDALGNLLKVAVTAGQRADITQAPALLENVTNSYVIADRGYDSLELRNLLTARGATPVIPYRANSKAPAEYDKHIYKERYLIECFFNKIKHFRHLFSRFDKTARNFSSFFSFVGALLWLR
jgi:transposase